MKDGIAEILKKTSNLRRKDERLENLRQNDCMPLRTVLQGCYHPAVQWVLPAGVPPYNPSRLVDQENVLYTEARKMYLFIQGGNDNLKPAKREALFIEILEKVSPLDAELLVTIKDKKMPDFAKNVTYDLAFEAFGPDLLPPKEG